MSPRNFNSHERHKHTVAMDLMKTLGQLYAERQRIGRIIATLEELDARKHPVPTKKRGRKSMDIEARLAVSERMKRYWASRRDRETDPSEPVPVATAHSSGES
jgi:hypothetical protein